MFNAFFPVLIQIQPLVINQWGMILRWLHHTRHLATSDISHTRCRPDECRVQGTDRSALIPSASALLNLNKGQSHTGIAYQLSASSIASRKTKSYPIIDAASLQIGTVVRVLFYAPQTAPSR